MRSIIGFALLLALLTPLSVAAAPARAGGTVIQFGRYGGNIRPFTVSIHSDGTVTSTGLKSPVSQLSSDALAGLMRLARAEHFFKMPHTLNAPGTLPDVARSFIKIAGPNGTYTVTAHGAANQHFDELFAVLSAAAGYPT